MSDEQPEIMYSTDDNCERLEYDDLDECIHCALECQKEEFWDAELTVYGYRRYVHTEDDVNDIAESLAERMWDAIVSDEHGDPDGEEQVLSEATKRILRCAVENACDEFECWDYRVDPELTVTVSLPEWFRAKGAEWLNNQQAVARIVELEAELALARTGE